MRGLLAVGAVAWIVTGLVFSEALDEKRREYRLVHRYYVEALERLGESERALEDSRQSLALCEKQRAATTDIYGALSGE